MKTNKTLFLLFALPLFSFATHKYYISLTQIEYKKEIKSVQIITNVFMDDIETAINNEFQIDLQLDTKNQLKDNDFYFKKYLEKNLIFKIDTIKTPFNYLGKEYDGNLVYFYLEIENIEAFETIEVTNTILIANFSNQQNLIKLKVGKQHKSVLLTANKYKGLLKN